MFKMFWLSIRTVLASLAISAGAAAGVPAVEVDTAADREVLRSGVELFEDAGGTLDAAAVRALPDGRWAPARALPLNLGYSRSAWWARVRLRNPDAVHAVQRVFEVDTRLQDYVDFAWIGPDGSVHAFPPAGDRRPFTRRVEPTAVPAFPIEIPPGATGTALVRLATHDGLHELTGFALSTRTGFLAVTQARAARYGLCYGVLLVLLVYSGFMAALSRQRIFWLYCGYLAALLSWSLIFTGYALQYLWPTHPALNNQLLPFAFTTAFACGLAFSSESLGYRKLLPRWHRTVQVIIVIDVLLTLPALAGYYAPVIALTLPLGAGTAVVHLLLGAVMARRMSRQALWTILGWVTLLASVAVYLLELTSVLPASADIIDVLLVGGPLQVLLMGLGLAESAETLRRDKLKAEFAALKAQEDLTTQLAQQVRERTSELEQANLRLNQLAITDGLTGAYNRRHFNEVLDADLKRLRRDGLLPALCLIDVDHFKAYNDRYGHCRGDEVLKSVAGALRSRLARAEDRLFRVGGEEFAIVLRPDDPVAQQRFVDGLRRAIEDLGIPHEGSPPGIVTASFGLAQDTSAGAGERLAQPSALYREADRLLYRAKAEGRNRVCWDERPVAEWAPASDFMPGP